MDTGCSRQPQRRGAAAGHSSSAVFPHVASALWVPLPLEFSINAKIMRESWFKGKSPKAVRKALKESYNKPREVSKELWLDHQITDRVC